MRQPPRDGLDPTGLLVRPFAAPVPPPTIRTFSIGDLMIIVAGTALGCAWTRANWFGAGATTSLPTWRTAAETWSTAIQLPTPLLFSLGISALLCRFAPPRPSWERIARQPGVVALAVLAFVMAVNATILFVGVLLGVAVADPSGPNIGDTPFLLPDAAELYVYQVVAAGPSVIVCWALQLGMGWWEPERSWIDRTGRALGVLLILIEFFGIQDWLGRHF